jgi:hypothetical protein
MPTPNANTESSSGVSGGLPVPRGPRAQRTVGPNPAVVVSPHLNEDPSLLQRVGIAGRFGMDYTSY